VGVFDLSIDPRYFEPKFQNDGISQGSNVISSVQLFGREILRSAEDASVWLFFE
jgi:hypothetical protein